MKDPISICSTWICTAEVQHHLPVVTIKLPHARRVGSFSISLAQKMDILQGVFASTAASVALTFLMVQYAACDRRQRGILRQVPVVM
jgi:hypothetical protein